MAAFRAAALVVLLVCSTAAAEDVVGFGRKSMQRELLQAKDPECRANPGRSNPCFSSDGSSNICCASPCGPLTPDGKPTCSGEQPPVNSGPGKCWGPKQLLYVWAGVSDAEVKSTLKDFVATVSIDRNNNYGKILSLSEIPYQNTEAHHMGLSPDGQFLVAGGVFASVKGLPQIYFYNVGDDPYYPRYTGNLDFAGSGATDQIVFDSKGRCIITQMGSKNGGTPGRLVEVNQPFPVDADSNSITPTYAEYGAGAPDEEKLNPHGLAVNPDSTVAVTVDFIEPKSLFGNQPSDIIFRDTVRIWRRNGQNQWQNTKTIPIPNAGGFQDATFIPGDSQQRVLTTAVGLSALVLVNPSDDSAKVVYNFEGLTCQPHVTDVSKDGKRYFVACIALGEVWMLDISNPDAPKLLDRKDTGGPASLPHYVKLSPDNDRLFVSMYFVTAGLASTPGARTVLSFNVKPNNLEPDTQFGTLAFADIKDDSGVVTKSRPHAMAVLYLDC